MSDFKTQLEALVNEAAKEYQADNNRQKFGPANSFKQGCDFLMPVLMKAIEQRNSYADECNNEHSDSYESDLDDKELLNILKGPHHDDK